MNDRNAGWMVALILGLVLVAQTVRHREFVEQVNDKLDLIERRAEAIARDCR